MELYSLQMAPARAYGPKQRGYHWALNILKNDYDGHKLEAARKQQ